MRLRLATRRLVTLATVLSAAACSESTSPNDDVTGTYQAVVLRITEGAVTHDVLAAGADLSMQLKSDGTTTGAFLIPGAYTESGEDETYPLNGTYTYNSAAGTVTFEQAGDTFVRDVTWEVGDNELSGVWEGPDFTVTAVLQIAPGVSES